MKMELKTEVNIKQKFETLLDAIIEAIVDIKDFFAYEHVTLSELVLLGLAFFRAVWFAVFGVENANYSFVFPDYVWIILFWTASLIHIAGLYFQKCICRVIAGYFYAGIWAFLMIVALISGTLAPAVPTLLILSIFSFAMILRLWDEYKNERC